MTFTAASLPSLVAFGAIVTGVLVAIVAGVFVACRRAGESPARPTAALVGLLAAWLGAVTALVASGAVEARPMPFVPIVMIGSVVMAIAFGLSPLGRRLASLPLWALVGFQSFRLPLELVLHRWAVSGTIPEVMTWSGNNFDILSGVVALATVPLLCVTGAPARRVIAWVANLVGVALLLNVMRVAVMSSPLPFAWKVSPPLLLLLHLPYAWIAPVCVGGALAGHVVLTRALLGQRL